MSQAQAFRQISQAYSKAVLDSEQLEAVVQILKLPLASRNSKNIGQLLEFIKGANFFRKLAEGVSEDVAMQCCLVMTYESVPENQVTPTQHVFTQGDLGTKFYVILSGECSIFIQSPSETKEVRILSFGDCFGELGLIDDKPRAASVLCRRETHLAVLEKTDYVRILSKAHGHMLNAKLQFLVSLPIFTQRTNWAMHKLSYAFREKSFRWKQALCKSGEDITEVTIIRSGEAQLQRQLSYPSQAQNRLMSPKSVKRNYDVALLRTGEMIGHEDEPRFQYTCVCHSETLLAYVISKEDFLKCVNTEESVKSLSMIAMVKKGLHDGRLDDGRRNVRLMMRSNSPKHRPSLSTNDQRPPRPTPAAGFTLIPRLYPERANTQSANTSQCPTPQRQRSWDQILTLKTTQSRLQKSSSSGLNLSKDRIVNIHTHKKRLKDLQAYEHVAESMNVSKSAYTSPREDLGGFPFLISAIEAREEPVRLGTASYRVRGVRLKKRTIATSP